MYWTNNEYGAAYLSLTSEWNEYWDESLLSLRVIYWCLDFVPLCWVYMASLYYYWSGTTYIKCGIKSGGFWSLNRSNLWKTAFKSGSECVERLGVIASTLMESRSTGKLSSFWLVSLKVYTKSLLITLSREVPNWVKKSLCSS